MKPMHEWESQEKITDDYLHQEVKNCLEYVDFSYSKHEWDNIPGILPRFLFYQSKYIDGLAGFCKEVSERESTESIRDDLNYKYKTLIDQIKESRNTDLTEKTLLIIKLWEKMVRNLNESMYHLYEMPAAKHFEYQTYLHEDHTKAEFQSQPRHYSLNQVRDLFYIHLNRSRLSHEFAENQKLVKSCENNIKQLIMTDEALRAYVDERTAHIDKKIEQMQDHSQLQQQYNEQKQAELGNRISMHNDYILKLQDFQKDTVKFHDSVRVMNDKTHQKIQQEKDNMNMLLELSCSELKQKIQEIDKFTTQQFDSLTINIDLFKTYTKESIEQKELNIMNKTTTYLNEMKVFVDDTATDLNQKRMEIQEKYEKKFNKVKEVITNYFERYDVDLEELKINMKVLNQKYADWSKILIEPTSLNEARLYALETRLHEEEDIRIKEYEYVRDLMKKLIFSLEQTNLTSLDLQKSTLTKTIDRSNTIDARANLQTPQLPNLLNNQALNPKPQLLEKAQTQNLNDLSLGLQHKTNDILMLKRLNFLKTSLDGHSPRQTTTNMRLKTKKKRDDRVIEIWKKEMEAPTVPDILQNYLKNKKPVTIDLSVQEQIANYDHQDSLKYNQSLVGAGASRNHEISVHNNEGDSVILTKRDLPNNTNQPQYLALAQTNFDTSISNVKTSNDSAFITQKRLGKQLNQTFHNGQQQYAISKLNQSMLAGSVVENSISLADKINRNKFLTNSDHKKIQLETQKDGKHRDKLYETFWSDFDSQHQTIQNQTRNIVNNSSKYQSVSRPRNLEDPFSKTMNISESRHQVNQTFNQGKKIVKNLASIIQEKRRGDSRGRVDSQGALNQDLLNQDIQIL
eukprot:403352105